ncbi:MAG: hypothetical protein J2P17_00130 [Mycobacterium sp.]|nr:hypothetical protein [Mycobacterium sp.]
MPVSSNHRELDRRPLLWLLGAHGGAGVTTLARLLAPAADCHRRWPGPATGQSPYVVLVARETTTGLASADALLRQHHAGLAGDCAVIGLVTVAARPGRVPASIRRDRKLYGELVSHLWRIDWHEAWTTTTHDALPVWNCTDAPPAHTSRDDLTTVPADVAALGRELITVIGTAEDPGPSMIGDKQ